MEIVESEGSDEELDENEHSESKQMMDSEFEHEISSPEQCFQWLSSIGYGHYVPKLRSNWEEDEVDGRTLRLLNVQDLVCFGLIQIFEHILFHSNCFSLVFTQKEYGIKAMYDRKMIIKAIGELS